MDEFLDDFDLSFDYEGNISDESFNNQVSLNVYSDDEFKQAMSCDLKFPCLYLKGLETEEELNYFRNKHWEEDSLVPLYCELEGTSFFITDINLDATALLLLHEMGNYQLSLFKNDSVRIPINLDEPSDIIKFIKL